MGWATKMVFVLLSVLSIYSISIIVNRYRILKSVDDKVTFLTFDEMSRQDLAFSEKLAKFSGLAKAHGSVGLRGESLRLILEMKEKYPEKVDRIFSSWQTQKRGTLDLGMTSLATLGNNAPFIGLFGTVLGIIQAFGVLAYSQGSGSNTVMAAIAESLIATAIGLFVAIPAVVAFNFYNRWIRDILTDCEIMRDFLLTRWQ